MVMVAHLIISAPQSSSMKMRSPAKRTALPAAKKEEEPRCLWNQLGVAKRPSALSHSIKFVVTYFPKSNFGIFMQSRYCLGFLILLILLQPAYGEDALNCVEHEALERYPGSVLEWCKTDNYLPFKIPVGPVTGYRQIDDWIDAEGRVSRTFYSLAGGQRTHVEVWKNYQDALKAAGFDILVQGVYEENNRSRDVGGGSWLEVYYRENPWGENGPVDKLMSGTSSSGGTGAVFARKERVDDTLYVLVTLEQHSTDEVASLFTIIETKKAETGLITANAEAIGQDIGELGRTVLHGLMFDYDSATLTAESEPVLAEVAAFLAQSNKNFYVVGHTDAKGTYAYNKKLSTDRAIEVRRVLVQAYGVTPSRLVAEGVGPLVPVFTNESSSGRAANRRVELVERP